MFRCNRRRDLYVPALAIIACLTAGAPASLAEELTRHQSLAREILKELIEINTTDSVGDTTKAAQAMAARLEAAGFPKESLHVLGSHPRKGNLVARYPGTGARAPLLLLAHLDVVEARREDWSFDPFRFREQDGYFYGRGSTDDKAMAAIWVANFIRMKEKGFTPDRDLIIALTADEEEGDHNGVAWLLENHRALIDAAYCLNEGGRGAIRHEKYLSNGIQLSEKVYMTVQLEVTKPGGGALPSGQVRLPRASRRDHPGLLRAHGGDREGGDRPGHEGGHSQPPRSECGRPALGRALLQRADANHLRGDGARGGARRERPSPDRPGDGQLPDAAGRLA
jgi:hypothetical protein